MGLVSRLRLRRRERDVTPARVVDESGEELFSWAPGRQPWLPGGTYVGVAGAWHSRVTREEAISVPSVKRGRDMVVSIASLPLVTLDQKATRIRTPFLEQIDPLTPNVVTLGQTLDDLLFEGVSWWEITHRRGDGFPAHARHLDHDAVSMQPPAGAVVQTLPSGQYPNGVVWVRGQAADARNVLRFDSPNDPVLVAGARVVRRAIKLAQAGEMYADDPEARAFWTPKGDTDPGDRKTILTWLRDFREARRQGAEGYLPAALERHVPQAPSAVDRQLAELQRRSDLEIANLLGVDPEDVGVNTTSRTYSNAVDRRIDRLNTVLQPYMDSITDRLSLTDVTRSGQRVVWDLHAYLRADPLTRWSTYATAIDKGVMTIAEIREREGLPSVPAKEKP